MHSCGFGEGVGKGRESVGKGGRGREGGGVDKAISVVKGRRRGEMKGLGEEVEIQREMRKGR